MRTGSKTAKAASPFFSVVTVCLNDRKGLETTWASLKEQTMDGFEWLVVDGGSKDGTLAFLETINDKRLEFKSGPDRGLYDAMNKGIEMASGVYLIFLNSDDFLASSTVLEEIRAQAEKNGLPDFIYGDALEKTESGELLYKRGRSHGAIWYSMFTHHQAMVYKACAVGALRYRLDYRIAADYAFTAEVLKKAVNILRLGTPVCVFTQGGISSKSFKRGSSECWRIRKDILGMPLHKRAALWLTQTTVYGMKKCLPFIYRRLRFS